MSTIAKRIGFVAVAGLVAYSYMAPKAYAPPANFGQSPAGFQPYFQVAPGLNIQQAAYNISTLGRAYQFVPPYAMYNPFVNPSPIVIGNTGNAGNTGATGGGLTFINSQPPFMNPYSPFNPYSPYGGGNPNQSPTLSTGGALPGYAGADMSSAYGSNPYAGMYADPYGGALRGTADLISAQGRGLLLREQANLVKEQVFREKLDNRRRAFDEWLYEREKTPSLQEIREGAQKLELRRSLNDPPQAEIWSAKALNDLLADIQKLSATDTKRLDSLPLDEEMLKRVNVTSGRPGNGNAGLLKHEGRLSWPLALNNESFKNDRDQVVSLLPDAIGQARNGKVDAGYLKELSAAVDRMSRQVTTNIRDLPPGQYMEAKRYLASLDEAVKLLSQPDAALYFTEYMPKGKTVADLVRYMTDKGIKFAPAVAGDEAAYVALHRGFAAYVTAVRSASLERVPGKSETK